MKKKRYYSGVFRTDFLVLGILLIVGTLLMVVNEFLGSPVEGLQSWRIMVGFVLLCVVVKLFMCLKITWIYIPIMFIYLVFERPLSHLCGRGGENLINHWILLLATAMLTLGTGLLFSLRQKNGFAFFSRKKRKKKKKGDDSVIEFSSSTKYIDATDFTREKIDNASGAVSVYFTNAEKYRGGGELEIDSGFGTVSVHVPSDWKILNNCEGDVENADDEVGDPDKTLKICGDCSLGSVEIVRVGYDLYNK